MKYLLLFITFIAFFSNALFAQEKDTVYVLGFYESGGVAPDNYGTLNDAVDKARNDGTINNTVFKLTPYEVYVLTKSIFIGIGESLEIVAPEPGTTQATAPPQIVWDESVPAPDADDYIIQTYGDIVLKNIWVRYADFLGVQRSSSITFIDTVAQGTDTEKGEFEGCLFDYCPIGTEAGGAITVDADHFTGIFKDCYFRNLSDNHFQYYGRAVSFPYQSTGYHYDKLLFENCTFSNLSRIVMQEGNEYGDEVLINHCTLINSIEWVYQSAGWLNKSSITNSIFINPYLMGYRPIDVCPDSLNGEKLDNGDIMDLFEAGACDEPGGGFINGITEVDSFGFTVDFTDYDRGLYIANNVYMYQDWMLDWYENAPAAKELVRNRLSSEVRLPSPMLNETEIGFIDSTDVDGNKVFATMNVDWETIYTDDPQFMVEPTNYDTLKLFIEGKWYTGLDIDWSYNPNSGFRQQWPLPENLAYTNAAYKTAAMGGFPLGDLNWFPDQKAAWEAQRDEEWQVINNWLTIGDPSGIREIKGNYPSEYVLKQNYPNPFNPTTIIEYSIPVSGEVSLKIYNSIGQEVATLFEGKQTAGKYHAVFDGSELASGIYMYRLQAGNNVSTKKLVLMK